MASNPFDALCLYYGGRFQPLLESRGLWSEKEGGRIDWRVRRSRVFVHWRQYRDRQTDRHSWRFQLDLSICQPLLLWFHMEAGEKGSVVKHLDSESDSCRTSAWDGQKNSTVRPGLLLVCDLKEIQGLKYAPVIANKSVHIPLKTAMTALTLSPEMFMVIIRGSKWNNSGTELVHYLAVEGELSVNASRLWIL